MTPNLLLMTDSYKVSHSHLYPKNMTQLYSYLESRGGPFHSTLFFGLQYYLRILARGFAPHDIDHAEAFWAAHFGRNDVFDAAAWRRLYEKHRGKIPLHITAVPEGSIVPCHNILMDIRNTDPEFPWLTSFFETLLLKVWYPTTVATQSFFIRQDIRKIFKATGSDMKALDFACHDFGYRGSTSEESAAIGGAAHLISFSGTDNPAGMRMLQNYYASGNVPGFSIPATEHSVICAFGKDHEDLAFAHMLEQFPTGVIACVSDTYDIYNAVENLWGDKFHDQVIARDGRLVVRPDSGDPIEVTLKVLGILERKFGGELNEDGFFVLNPHVRVIYGDRMTRTSIPELYRAISSRGYAAENLVTGSGGGLLQKVDRDTCKFAIKASHVVLNADDELDIAKSPVTDPSKKSKSGRLSLRLTNGEYSTVSYDTPLSAPTVAPMKTVFLNGEIQNVQTLNSINTLVKQYEEAH